MKEMEIKPNRKKREIRKSNNPPSYFPRIMLLQRRI